MFAYCSKKSSGAANECQLMAKSAELEASAAQAVSAITQVVNAVCYARDKLCKKVAWYWQTDVLRRLYLRGADRLCHADCCFRECN